VLPNIVTNLIKEEHHRNLQTNKKEGRHIYLSKANQERLKKVFADREEQREMS